MHWAFSTLLNPGLDGASVAIHFVQNSSQFVAMKIDVEGFEREVLEGAEEIIRQCKPIIFLELHGSIIHLRGHNPRAVLSKLARLGYGQFLQKGRELTIADFEARFFNARFVCLPKRFSPT